tara:strand:- start:1995 stop:2945 length:951 start_codon:yes stop_codon:yes gene_type:complete
MIIITGGSGFIGSNLAKSLNTDGEEDLLIIEELDKNKDKFENITDIKYIDCIDKYEFIENLKNNTKFANSINIIFHMGACSKTTEKDREYVMETNLEYSKELLHFCSNNSKSLIYASSASVYGNNRTFVEEEKNEETLNHYADSKLQFDNYFRDNQNKISSQVVGLRYFNVYGPREQHKTGMHSVVLSFYNQLERQESIKLFKASHGYADGEQRRDFIHVDDTVKVKKWFSSKNNISGIYNVGTGESRSFNDVAKNVIQSYNKGEISYIEFPEGLEAQYQAFTEANINKIRECGYETNFLSIEEGVKKYIDWLQRV